MPEITWPDLPAAQQPVWPDAVALEEAQRVLRGLPPLVFAGECDDLRTRLAQASAGDAFVLMGGDCAETFAHNTADSIRARLKTLLQMAIVLTYGASLPVVKIGRIAGQYGKHKISFCAVNPGPVRTERWAGLVKAMARDMKISVEEADTLAPSSIPMGRIAEVEEVANLVVMLASPLMEMVNGTMIEVDGGQDKPLMDRFRDKPKG